MIMAQKEVMAEASLRLLLLPQIERKAVRVRPAHSEETEIEVPPLLQENEAPFTTGNKRTIQTMKDVVLEMNKMVCIAIEPHKSLEFYFEFFFYMNNVKVAFFDADNQKYTILNGAPRKARNQERGIFREFFPV